MPPLLCHDWEYEHHPDHTQVGKRCVQILVELRSGVIDPVDTIRDSRATHRRLFKGLTPSKCVYLAGHYRGENFPALLRYNVRVPMDSRVGVDAIRVIGEMSNFVRTVDEIFLAFDIHKASKENLLPEEHFLLLLVQVATELHVDFLRIHPYANGNGHIARFLVWCLLSKYGYWPKSWPFDDQPSSPYAILLSRYRDGDKEPLINLILAAIVGA